VIAGIGTLQLIGSELNGLATEAGGSVEGAVVVHDHASAAGKTNIEFETVRTERQPVVECRKGVLGREGRSTPVCQYEGPCRSQQRVRRPPAADHR
jgi:hypothetical protein